MAFTLGIITARGGSKGIKSKNIIPLLEKPLIQYTIEAAQEAKVLDDLILSTDDQNIADVAAGLGLSIHGLRPAHLATDTAKSSDVLLHEIEAYEKRANKKVGNILLLQPTAPLRTGDDIKQAYTIFENNSASSLISCYNAEAFHPQIMYTTEGKTLTPLLQEGKTIIQRQEMPPVYIRNGALYLTDSQYFKETGNLVCDAPLLYEMTRENSINIDSPEDLDLAAYYLTKRGQNV